MEYRNLYSMKATLDIPDELYRRVKARSAMEGRPIRSVAVDLFQKWLEEEPKKAVDDDVPPNHEKMPWLAIARRYVREDQNHDMDDIKEAIAAGWGAEVAGKLNLTKP
jgi:hypothetical protein